MLSTVIIAKSSSYGKLYFGFVDLEKAFDRVPREVISWELKSGLYQQ